MHFLCSIRSRRLLISWCMCCLALFVAACGSSGNGNGSNPGTSKTPPAHSTPGGSNPGGGSTPTPVVTTAPMPPVQTSCPVAGTGRAAVMAPLALGSHQNIVYAVNSYSGNTPTSGVLKRYDVASGSKTEIVNLANTTISEAQVSADGQWILFVAITGGQAKLQLVRMDGQGLQTLYCGTPPSNGANTASALRGVQWSSDQKLAIFDSYNGNGSFVYLLNMRSGSVQAEISLIGAGYDYTPLTWLDTTRVYLLAPEVDQPPNALYLLDTSKGAHQNPRNLQQVVNPSNVFCWDSDSSYDGSQLFTSECTTDPSKSGPGISDQRGPSTIDMRAATGGTAHVIFNGRNTMAITAVRAISKTTLLFLVENNAYGGGNADTSQNGLWMVNTDGSGLKRLTSDGAGVSGGPSNFCPFTQEPWSNVSHDGKLYALQHTSANGKMQSLLFGTLNGGTPTQFDSFSDGTQLAIVGWTMM